jgi:hypothetical protein
VTQDSSFNYEENILSDECCRAVHSDSQMRFREALQKFRSPSARSTSPPDSAVEKLMTLKKTGYNAWLVATVSREHDPSKH